MNQKKLILTYLQRGNSLTPLEALNMFGSFRLGAVIFELKKEGHNIKTTMVSKGKKHFASYKIEPRIEPYNQLRLF